MRCWGRSCCSGVDRDYLIDELLQDSGPPKVQMPSVSRCTWSCWTNGSDSQIGLPANPSTNIRRRLRRCRGSAGLPGRARSGPPRRCCPVPTPDRPHRSRRSPTPARWLPPKTASLDRTFGSRWNCPAATRRPSQTAYPPPQRPDRLPAGLQSGIELLQHLLGPVPGPHRIGDHNRSARIRSRFPDASLLVVTNTGTYFSS